MRWLLVTGVALLPLVGCSSTPKIDYEQSQYCYTDQRIEKNDDSVNSKTVLECTDRPSRQTEIQRAGVDPSCKEFWYPEVRRGQRVMQKGVYCEKFDGTREIINIYGNTK